MFWLKAASRQQHSYLSPNLSHSHLRPSMLQQLLRRLVFDVPLLTDYCKMPLRVGNDFLHISIPFSQFVLISLCVFHISACFLQFKRFCLPSVCLFIVLLLMGKTLLTSKGNRQLHTTRSCFLWDDSFGVWVKFLCLLLLWKVASSHVANFVTVAPTLIPIRSAK